MKKINKEWLDQLAGTAKAQKDQDAREEKKQALLLQLGSDRERQAETLLAGSNLKMKKGRKTQKTLDLENRDQTEEFDLDEQRDGYELVDDESQENFQKHLQTARLVDQMVLKMQSQMSDLKDKDGKPLPLFSKEEIMAEVYDPLVRRGLIAETNVPNEFSRTKELLDASFEAYAKRLKADKLSTGKLLFKENFALVKTMTTSTFSIAGSSMQLEAAKDMTSGELATNWDRDANVTSLKQGLGEIPRDNGSMATTEMIASTRMGFAGQALGFVTDVGYEGVNDLKGLYDDRVAARIKAAPPLAMALANGASAELVAALSETGLALEVGSVFGAKVNRSAITLALKNPEFEDGDAETLLAQLADACAAALRSVSPSPGVADMEGAIAAIDKAAKDMVSHITSAGLKTSQVLDDLAGEEFGKVAAQYQAAVKAGCAKAVTAELVNELKNDKVRGQVMAAASETLNAAFNEPEEEKAPPDVEDAHKSILSHEAIFVHGKGGWVCSVCATTNTEDPAVFAGILDAKIKQLQRDQAALKWAATLVGMGIDTAANFVAPLAIVGCALKMARNLYEAATRTRDMVKFIEDRQGMYNAASAFSAPVTQFIRNAGVQQAHYYANAGFEAAKMIGAIIQCSGAMAAPAGAVVSASATIAQAVEAVLYEVAKRLALEKAWSDYKHALSRPENRKAGLIALKNNPTLAKYAVAWGAVIKKDPLVADFMGACGLTPEALKDPDANLDKVVSYLETRMPDDNVVTGRSIDEPAAPWAPDTLELTARSWISVKSLGETHVHLEPQDTLPLEAALQRYQKASPAWLSAAKASPSTLDEPGQTAWLAQLKTLDQLLSRVSTARTKESGGGNSPEMDDVVAKLRKQVTDDKKLAEAGFKKPEPKKTPEPEKTN